MKNPENLDANELIEAPFSDYKIIGYCTLLYWKEIRWDFNIAHLNFVLLPIHNLWGKYLSGNL